MWIWNITYHQSYQINAVFAYKIYYRIQYLKKVLKLNTWVRVLSYFLLLIIKVSTEHFFLLKYMVNNWVVFCQMCRHLHSGADWQLLREREREEGFVKWKHLVWLDEFERAQGQQAGEMQ